MAAYCPLYCLLDLESLKLRGQLIWCIKDVCQYFPQCAKCQPHQQWEWGPESVLQGARQLEAGGLFLFDNRNGDPLTVMFWHGEYLSLCLCWWRDNVRNVPPTPPPLLHVCTLKRRHSSPSPARATTLEMEIGLSSLYICVPHLFFIMQSSRAELQECGVALNCCQLIKKRRKYALDVMLVL